VTLLTVVRMRISRMMSEQLYKLRCSLS
jgi:hypothetical protein